MSFSNTRFPFGHFLAISRLIYPTSAIVARRPRRQAPGAHPRLRV